MNISVAEAKNNFTKLLRLAESGEEITILRHGRPVAQLRAVPPELRPKQDDTLTAALNEIISPGYLKHTLRS